MPNHEKLHDLLNDSVKHFPDSTVLICEENSVTYHDLFVLSENFQQTLLHSGIEKNSRIAIYASKSMDVVAAIFGILKHESAYVPVDAGALPERNHYIVINCEVRALLIEEDFADYFLNDFEIINNWKGYLLLKNKQQHLKVSPPGLAYILYTSGSTGTPKGVMYSHHGAMKFVNWCSSSFNITAKDRFSSHAPFHFDLSVFDLFVCIKHAASLVIITDKVARQPMQLVKLIEDNLITIWYSTPTILNLMTEYGKMERHNLTSLKTILFAGEVYPLHQFLKLQGKVPQAKYYNLYGPTESNVCCYYQIKHSEVLGVHIPIGKPCGHYKATILNNQKEGELLISGNALMNGYWNNEQLTNEKYMLSDATLWYKTGDIVIQNEDGNYIFKGRLDRMIKRNGYRIELDEIEITLLKDKQIVSCAVIANSRNNTTQIIAFIVTPNESFKSLIKMKALCTKLLNSYMIPDDFIFLNSIPVTSSNKTDYQYLIKNV